MDNYDTEEKKSKKLRMEKTQKNRFKKTDPTNCWFEKTKQNENEDSKKSPFCILRKQTLQTVGLKKRNKTKMKTQKYPFFSHPF